MEELPKELKIEKMTIHELRDEARKRGLRGFWALRRDRLVELLFPEHVHETTPDKNEKNHSKANEHYNPKNHNPKDIRVEDMEYADHKGF
jgi:hypothetical protein